MRSETGQDQEHIWHFLPCECFGVFSECEEKPFGLRDGLPDLDFNSIPLDYVSE